MLEELLKQAGGITLAYGLIGVVALVEAIVIVVIFKAWQASVALNIAFGQKVVESQNNTANALDKVADITTALNRLTDVVMNTRRRA